ncbi:hypothetical protein [Bartonella pachyuromydis]
MIVEVIAVDAQMLPTRGGAKCTHSRSFAALCQAIKNYADY